MATEPVPSAPPPPSAISTAKPLTQQELSQEHQPKAPPTPTMRPPVLPEAREQKESPPRPDFKEALKKRVLEAKPEEVKPTPPEKQAEPQKQQEPAKQPVSKDDAPPAKVAPVPDEVPEDQRRVLPHDKPDTAKRIKAILAERDAARQEAAAAKTEYEAAKKAPATPPEELLRLKQEHEAAQGELLRLRRLHEIHNDPEFATKYREPVKQAEKSIEETLKRNGLTEPVLKVIQDAGGFSSFSRSTKTFTVNEPDPENEGQMKPVSRTAGELARSWLASLPVADAEMIRASLGKQALLQDEEKNAIAQAQAEAKGYFENQTKAQREAAEAANRTQQQTMAEYKAWLKSTDESVEWLKDRSLPDNATPEQKAEVQRYNEFNKQLRDKLRKDPTNAKEYGELKLEAAEAHHLRRTLGDKDAEIAALKEQLSRAKGAMRTTPKAGSILKGDGKPEKKDADVDSRDPMKSLKERLRSRLVNQQEE